MDNIKHRRLQEMDRSDFGVIKGEPDIRGWDVRNSSGRKIGEVEELIVDAQERKVRYMVVDLDDNELDLRKHRVLIPIGLAELDKEEDDVLLPSVSVEQLRHLPTYDLNILDDTTEKMICVVLGREEDQDRREQRSDQQGGEYTTGANQEFYRHNYFDDDNLYKHRLHEAQPARTDRRSDERGLRLWDTRNDDSQYDDEATRRKDRDRELDEERRLEMVRARRRSYQDRRGRSDRGDLRDDDLDRRFR
jgi:sporulation protein YlmC with PRC-barrel domain